MHKPIIFMFSGQGSQYYHMGKELFEKNESFQTWMKKLDKYSKELIGKSIIDIIYDPSKNKADIFNEIIYTNPAIFTLQYALAQVFIEMGIKPDYVLGTSLGELVSFVISEVISYEEGLYIANKLSETIEGNCPEGGMLAILYNYQHYYENPEIYKDTEIAAINFDSHFIVSGKIENLNHIKQFLDRKNIIHQILPVSYAFHSHITKPAEPVFLDYLKQKNYNFFKIPIISCSRVGILPEIQYEYINEAIRKPIEFQKTIQLMERDGNYIYLDLGPSGTLATFVKYILSKESHSEAYVILNPFGRDMDNLKKVTELLLSKEAIIIK